MTDDDRQARASERVQGACADALAAGEIGAGDGKGIIVNAVTVVELLDDDGTSHIAILSVDRRLTSLLGALAVGNMLAMGTSG